MYDGVGNAPAQKVNSEMMRHSFLPLSALIIPGCAGGGGVPGNEKRHHEEKT